MARNADDPGNAVTAFGILVKSHAPDRDYAERLLASIAAHNVDHIPVFLVVPENDMPTFTPMATTGVDVLSEARFQEHLTGQSVAGFSPGYINQEIVKLCFWEAGLVDNYLCVDSDAEFIRDFHLGDFMADEATPFTFLTADAELIAEPAYFEEHWSTRAKRLETIRAAIGLETDRILTVHGHAVFSAVVLRGFVERFLTPRGWDYVDALALAPLEPTWYSLWLQHDRTIPIVTREPVIKTFHNPSQYLDYVVRGIGRDEVARGYVGIVLNSNYSRGDGLIDLSDETSAAVARYVPGPTILTALGHRARHSLQRLRER